MNKFILMMMMMMLVLSGCGKIHSYQLLKATEICGEYKISIIYITKWVMLYQFDVLMENLKGLTNDSKPLFACKTRN